MKKWVVKMVVWWVGGDVRKECMMVLVGKGGMLKRRFLEDVVGGDVGKYLGKDCRGE